MYTRSSNSILNNILSLLESRISNYLLVIMNVLLKVEMADEKETLVEISVPRKDKDKPMVISCE